MEKLAGVIVYWAELLYFFTVMYLLGKEKSVLMRCGCTENGCLENTSEGTTYLARWKNSGMPEPLAPPAW